ncbi:MAG: DUF1573 domain-containing protein [Phycisphaerales bacterium]
MTFVKTGVLCAAVLTVVAGTTLGQETPKAPQPGGGGPLTPINAQPTLAETNKGGAFQFETMVHDWGAIGDEEPVKTTFTFKNITDKTVKIINTKTSCGCTVGTPTKQVLAPGEDAAIEIVFTPKGKRGLELKTITLETDYPQQPNIDLHLKALVRPRMVIEPSSVWFGDLKLKEAKEQELSVMNRMEGFQVTSFNCPDAKFKVEKIDADKVEMDGGQVDRVRFKASFLGESPIGTYSTSMTINTNDPKNPSYTISLACRVVGELQPVPERMFVAMGAVQQPWTAEVQLSARTQKEFEIYSVEPVDCPPEMKIVLDVQAGSAQQPSARNTYRVRASGLTPAAVTDIRGSVRVRTNVAGMEDFSIPLMGLWRGPMKPPANAAPAVMPHGK